jgi:hypothetical protein
MVKKRRRSTNRTSRTPSPPPEETILPTDQVQAKPQYKEESKGKWRNTNQLALDTYYNLKNGGINEPQHKAGIRLHELFSIAGMDSMATPGYWYMGEELGTRVDGLGGKGSDRRELQDRARSALLAVSGTIGRQIVEAVCCYNLYLKDLDIPGYEKGEYKMRRFKEALDELVEHFRIPIPQELQHHYTRRWKYDHTEAYRERRARRQSNKSSNRVHPSSK